MSELDDLTFITVVAEPGTPTDLQPHAGKVIGVPSNLTLTQATRLFGLPGKARKTLDGWQWVLGAEEDRTAALIDSIAGGAWASAEARQTYAQLGRQLIQRGVTVAQARTALTNAYNAAVQDREARG